MARIERIKEFVAQKNEAQQNGGVRELSKANKKLSGIINDMVDRAKENINENNDYKSYFEKNQDIIKEQVGLNTDVQTVEEAMELIKQVDFRYLFGLDIALKESFYSDFISNGKIISFVCKSKEEADKRVEEEIYNNPGAEPNVAGCYERFGVFVREIRMKGERIKAWIEFDRERGKYLYKIGDMENEYSVIAVLDIFDLYQIFFKCDIRTALKELAGVLIVRIGEIEALVEKYKINKEFIKNNLKDDRFPTLYELIGEHINKLDILLEEANNKAYNHGEHLGDKVFYSSMEYIANLINKSKSTVNPVINTFVLLGLIEKRDISIRKYSKYNRNEITFFYIPTYNEKLLAKAEQLAKMMLYDGERITSSKFSYSNCIQKFGEETANKIFKDKVVKARAS